MRTQAAVSYGPDTGFTIEDVEISDPRPDEILVRLTAAGICHTDLATKALMPAGVPAVYGHEGAGIVEATGADVTGVRAGDRVVLSYNSCGACARCAAGRRVYCERFVALNNAGRRPDGSSTLSRQGGDVWSSFFGQSSFARHALATRENIVVVPEDTDLVAAAPMGCGFQTGAGSVVNLLRPTPDSSLVVYGAGGVGLAAVMAAAALGTGTVIAVDLSKERRALATELGATHALDGASADLVEQIRDLTAGGATHGFDTTGVPGVIRNAALALAPLGSLVVVGLGSADIGVDVMDLIGGGKTIRGSIEGDANPHELVPLLLDWHAQGRFPADRVISTFAFEDIDEAVARMRADVVKPVLTF
ncbi:NAD(P)-dependent alcohol dehydrogenase [Streptomyces ipomoeae]|uniref:Oxidoreductase, zinc-binding dehydrogenase family protein n=1 Tax=Streptomyces ipomoeae 91-03 TaxID=698759 RepID=L1L7A3_9ACTN|nr:NAD(P)-dependent alcohol dehydrogenase [Streptomyces ipomoeae]EKX68772.1 oxidoreductase, zinc-binding dehydrogenase family protein [Streptomyces ipomoeae 91-03]MDX2694103.1 NAD(P)-dependent alcohol dehydrogenase [Streptomyces ipomoeae]MDX2837785.1 NAD(P)-dependent alcohol dehydrogenase [Streptomyces ipomoeae]TQE23592.1 NAD(P)-dependent alcohol dehydrogenase [Streptomyces ipomoeae]